MTVQPRPSLALQPQPQSSGAGNCPECSTPVAAQSGCVTCPSCGWSRCG